VRTIIFENHGEIDPVAISTFGISVKEGESPIGMFGTGLKYAIAVLLRTGHRVLIQSGETQHEFGLRTATVRGKDFDLITMDGRDLGFTTHYGFKWELWMAYRELHCNCLDEGGTTIDSDALPDPFPGATRVIVQGDDFAKIHDERGMFLLTSQPAHVVGDVEIHLKSSPGFFFKGILVHKPKSESPPRYTYNFRRGVDLTEDRTAKFPNWEWGRVRDAIRACDDEALIREMLTINKIYQEFHFDYDSSMSGKAEDASPAFFRAVEALMVDRSAEINPSALRLYKRLRHKDVEPEPKVLSVIEQKQLDRAITFCRGIGFQVDDYPIVVTESLGKGILGLAVRDTERIYIAVQAFDHGTKRVAGTLIEEWAHLKHRLDDESRDMQNWLLDRLVGVGERAQGEPL
jgi:hypothetical protein